MSLSRWLWQDPWHEFARMQRDLDRAFGLRNALTVGGGNNGPASSEGSSGGEGGSSANQGALVAYADWNPRCDLSETDTGLHIEAEIPGVEKDNIKVELDGDLLM